MEEYSDEYSDEDDEYIDEYTDDEELCPKDELCVVWLSFELFFELLFFVDEFEDLETDETDVSSGLEEKQPLTEMGKTKAKNRLKKICFLLILSP